MTWSIDSGRAATADGFGSWHAGTFVWPNSRLRHNLCYRLFVIDQNSQSRRTRHLEKFRYTITAEKTITITIIIVTEPSTNISINDNDNDNDDGGENRCRQPTQPTRRFDKFVVSRHHYVRASIICVSNLNVWTLFRSCRAVAYTLRAASC